MDEQRRTFAPRRVDALLVIVVAVTGLALFLLGGEDHARAPDAVGAVLLGAAALPLAHRRRPLLGFGVQVALVMAYLSLGYAGGAELPALLAGLYCLAVAGHRAWALVGAVAFVALGIVYRVSVEGEHALTVTIGSSLLVLVALLGDSVHSRRELHAETRRRLRTAEAEKESEARARVAEERLRIAHELHDVMAHTITSMSVQAGAALDQLDREPKRAGEALRDMRRASRDAMTELRAIIGVLRGPDEARPLTPAPGLDRLEEVVRATRNAGVEVEVETPGLAPAGWLPAAVDVTSFRIVQEALTNVVRHADARRATVRIERDGPRIILEVTDDGRGAAALGPEPGYGLMGLRERAAAVEGELEAGDLPDGGFRVRAVIPVTRRTVDHVAG